MESLDKIQYIEHKYKGQILKTKTVRLPEHTHEILEAVSLTKEVAKKK